MTNKEILEKAIRKAIEGGWDYLAWEYNDEHGFTKKSHERYNENSGRFITDWQSEIPYPHLIYNHDFAKALWGTKHKSYAKVFQRVTNGVDVETAVTNGMLQAWQYHLQQMVIADDPIKYLEANI